MDAATLYSQIKVFANLDETTICHLHKSKPKVSCINDTKIGCENPSKTNVLDFDAVKVLYCIQNKIAPQLDSVDAITHNQQIILFVEIKSNKNFLQHQLKNTDTTDIVNKKIDRQVTKYNLKDKINDSIEICKGIAKDNNLFDKIEYIYVLVTDINTLTNPMQRFQAQLNVAAYKSININHLLVINKKNKR
ncbi:MAG: hypothetical protein IKQ46_17780 [Bacteroidales bacterium]|nr:hypothetical protein [Bacteroidales bacterium]